MQGTQSVPISKPIVKRELLKAARQYISEGISVVPVDANKKATIEWKQYQKRLMTDDELVRYFGPSSNAEGIALVCGQVSAGGLEALDFDHKVPDKVACAYNTFSDIIRRERPELFEKLVINTTPNSGCHMPFICTQTDTPGSNPNLAKAEYQADGETKTTTLIETKGEGGYFIVPPTPGYQTIQGDLSNIPTISADDRSLLIKTARQSNQVEHKQELQPSPRLPKVRQDGEQKAGDLYNQTDEFKELLTKKHEWTLVKKFGTQEQYKHPNSDNDSSTTFHTDTRLFNVFSTSVDPLEAGGSYDPFGLLVRLEFDGDCTAATKWLYQQHPEWSIPSNGYKPSQREQTANDAQLEGLAGLHGETPEEIEVSADSRDVGRGGDRKSDQAPKLGFDISQAEAAETASPLDEAGKTAQMRQAMQDTDTSTVELMKWTPGTGKTYEAETVAVEMAERGQNTIFAMLTHERAEQEAEVAIVLETSCAKRTVQAVKNAPRAVI